MMIWGVNSHKMSNLYKTHKNTQGFTLIELMIATIIFSMVLLVMLAGFLQVSRMFYKGVTISSTNEAARTLVDSIINDYRFTQSAVPIASSGSKRYFCIGSHRYTYITAGNAGVGAKVDSGDLVAPTSNSMKAGIVVDTVSTCNAPNNIGTNARQLIGLNMQLNDFNFIPANNGVFVHARVVFYGVDNQVFTSVANPNNPDLALLDADAHCEGDLLNTSFCAMADFRSTVALRD
jgi:prepilin-type N-terminal cleavage/methylation domain-containing protein